MSRQKPAWHFKELRPGDTVREPIHGEYFANEAISDSAEALVRESIQNTLDARANGQTPEVRIYLSCLKSLSREVNTFLEELWPHIHAGGNGLREPPQQTGDLHYLVYEDFGTTGLEGDPAQWRKEKDKNHFFNFFRAEGHSDKSETDRGRWGVGKTVFPRSSRASTFWALTVRASDGKRLLMGRAILKSHKVKGQDYSPDGYFGVLGNDGLVLPVDDGQVLDSFCQLFNLQRKSEPGLSVVIPWYHPNDLRFDAIVRAVIRGYFWPIMKGELKVDIKDSERSNMLDRETLEQVLEQDQQLKKDLGPVIKLAQWANGSAMQAIKELNRPSEKGALRWTADLIPEEVAVEIRTRLQTGEMIAVRVPMPVREKKKSVEWSFFDMFLVRDGTEGRGRPVFVREGIIIPDVRCRTTRGVRALVVVEDKPLATMLGDAENPSHTQWQKECSNYKGKYLFGPSNIEFVSNAVAEIVRLVTETEKEADPAVLIDLFSLPAEPNKPGAVKAKAKKPKQEKGKGPPEKMDLLEPKPRPFTIERIAGGFRIRSGHEKARTPATLEVHVAYDVRLGNPLKKYHKADFDLESNFITLEELHGIEVVERKDNKLVLKVLENDFRLSVKGFDSNRDLYVKVLAREENNNADQPT